MNAIPPAPQNAQAQALETNIARTLGTGLFGVTPQQDGSYQINARYTTTDPTGSVMRLYSRMTKEALSRAASSIGLTGEIYRQADGLPFPITLTAEAASLANAPLEAFAKTTSVTR